MRRAAQKQLDLEQTMSDATTSSPGSKNNILESRYKHRLFFSDGKIDRCYMP